MDKIKTLVRKEWAEVFKNKMVFFTVAFLPLMMVVLPLGILIGMGGAGESIPSDVGEMPAQFSAFCREDLESGECFQVFMVSQFMIMFMIVPLAIPATIAAYSIVGEKTTRTLESILATPVTTMELLFGKSLAALIPAVAATYIAFGIYAIGVWVIVRDMRLFTAMVDARWLLAVFLVGPLMALMAVNFSLMVSSRVNDPRVAEQLSMIVILPVVGFFLGQIAGLFVINSNLVLITAAVLVVIDAILVYAAVQLFQRETILTRWK